MKNFKDLIDKSFGENYSSTYFDGEQLRSGYFTISNSHGLIIYSQQNEKWYLNLIAVFEKGKGYGSDLLNTFYSTLQNDFYVQTWKYDGNLGLTHWIEKNGGVVVEIVENYWLKDSVERNYSCSLCGHPCTCTMTLYLVRYNQKK